MRSLSWSVEAAATVLVASLAFASTVAVSTNAAAPLHEVTTRDSYRFVTRSLGTLPYGSGPLEFAEPECEDDPDCDAGFAFLGEDGRVYVFDFARQDLKCIEVSGPHVGRVETIPLGLADVPNFRLRDGAATRVGDIYLLWSRERGNALPMLRLLSVRAGDSCWSFTDEFECPNSKGGPPYADSELRLGVYADSCLVVYLHGLDWDGGVIVSVNGHVLETEQRCRLPDGYAIPGGTLRRGPWEKEYIRTPEGDSLSLSPREMRVFGVDSTGRIFSRVIEDARASNCTITAYDPAGSRLARRREHLAAGTETDFQLFGLRNEFVLPDGRLIELCFRRKGLDVVEWRLEPKHAGAGSPRR